MNMRKDRREAPRANQVAPGCTVVGTETEFGIYRPTDLAANPIALSTLAVETYASHYRGDWGPVGWDYVGEDPLNDMRGMRLSRAHVDPSMLTDDPYHLAPPGGQERLSRPTEAELHLSRPSSIVLPNGGRYYVDHAHPEYSSPEVATALEGVMWDRAGDEIARRTMEFIGKGDDEVVLVKNNVDGKGATYGSHENYLIPRSTDLDEVIRFMIPFLVTRPIICGAGRVGIGQHSKRKGFQISQRADYVENDIGLETTFNRPIFNTRDEPHANHHYWRRIHVIGGDANQFDVSILLKLGTTALVLEAIQRGTDMSWDTLDLMNPVDASQEVSRDLTLRQPLAMRDGSYLTALEIQGLYLDLVERSLEQTTTESARCITECERLVLSTWRSVLEGLQTDPTSLASEVEWVGKYVMFNRQRERLGLDWDAPVLAAMDIQWGDLRPDKSIVAALDQAGLVKRLVSQDKVRWAADNPPPTTRAAKRGTEVAHNRALRQASWSSLVYDVEPDSRVRVPLADPQPQNCRPPEDAEANSRSEAPGRRSSARRPFDSGPSNNPNEHAHYFDPTRSRR